MITVKQPQNWQDLQTAVAQILSECQLHTDVEAKKLSVRGNVEIDVIARGHIAGRNYLTVIECKNWTTRVSQTVVHSFMTVVQGVGANIGYIVSKAGFQSGAIESANLTNIQLKTWNEFQLDFENEWYDKHFVSFITDNFDDLQDYLQPLTDIGQFQSHLSDSDVNDMWRLYNEHIKVGHFILLFYPAVYQSRPVKLTLPLTSDVIDAFGFPEEFGKIEGYREFLESFAQKYEPVLLKFREYEAKAKSAASPQA